MRALQIIHDRIRSSVPSVHAARWSALWRTVLALIAGRRLWLTALGRSLPGDVGRKHAIKAVDRLLGNRALHRERTEVASSLATILVKGRQVVVLVDTVEIRTNVVGFVASIAHNGRSLPIWSSIVSSYRVNAAACRKFLAGLREVLPPRCCPILITDGGFETKWFDDVEAFGWSYVGRVRGQVKFTRDGQLWTCADLHAMAGRRAKNLSGFSFPSRRPRERRLVLSKLPVCRHRQIKTRSGPARGSNYWHYRKNAYEPLILTTSLKCHPQDVARLYATRMQIEQNFRDLKNHRWGWSLRHCGSRAKERVEVLLLIAALATFVPQVAGIAAEHSGLQRQHQANTVRHRRVLSSFVLGGLVLASQKDELTVQALRSAIRRIRHHIEELVHLRR